MKRLTISMLIWLPMCAYAFNDPTRPPNYQQAASSLDSSASVTENSTELGAATITDFKLSMIAVNKKNAFAVINGKAVSVGDQVNNATVKTIGDNKVELNVNGEVRSVLLTGVNFITQSKNQ